MQSSVVVRSRSYRATAEADTLKRQRRAAILLRFLLPHGHGWAEYLAENDAAPDVLQVVKQPEAPGGRRPPASSRGNRGRSGHGPAPLRARLGGPGGLRAGPLHLFALDALGRDGLYRAPGLRLERRECAPCFLTCWSQRGRWGALRCGRRRLDRFWGRLPRKFRLQRFDDPPKRFGHLIEFGRHGALRGLGRPGSPHARRCGLRPRFGRSSIAVHHPARGLGEVLIVGPVFLGLLAFRLDAFALLKLVQQAQARYDDNNDER